MNISHAPVAKNAFKSARFYNRKLLGHQTKAFGTSIQLGKSSLQISKIGLGTLQWGDPGQGYGQRYTKEELKEVFDHAIKRGVNFFDTAEIYGYQGIRDGSCSEQLLDSFIAESKSDSLPLVVGTKFFTIPWTNFLVGGGLRLGKKSILEAFENSLGRISRIDLYQVHFPFPTMSQQMIADALLELMDRGSVKAVGVCNYNVSQLQDLDRRLSRHGVSISSNQVKCSVLEQSPLKDGLLSACHDVGATMVAHSPLSQGLLTGKTVGSEGQQALAIRPLLKLMEFIGAVYGGKSITQVALNYLVAQGVVPIPGAKSLAQVEDQLSAMDWVLEENELEMINEKVDSLP